VTFFILALPLGLLQPPFFSPEFPE